MAFLPTTTHAVPILKGPEIEALEPATKMQADGSFIMRVRGLRFTPDCLVRLDTTEVQASWLSATVLVVFVPAALLATAGVREVTVFNPAPDGGLSNVAPLAVSGGGMVAWADDLAGSSDISQKVVQLSGGSWQGGVGVVRVPNAASPPSSNPSAAALLYAASGALKTRTSAGSILDVGFAPGGDLTGTNESQTVAKLRNVALSVTPPTTGQFMRYTGTELAYAAVAKGDLAPAGTAGQVLTIAVGGTALEWVTPAGGGGGGAPTTSSYVTLAADGALSNERVLTQGTGVLLADAGAGSTITLSADFGTGAGKVAQATKAALESVFGFSATGVVRTNGSGVFSSTAITKVEVETAMALAAGIVRSNGSNVLTASSLGKVEVETALSLSTTGFVRSTAGVLSSALLTKTEIEGVVNLATTGLVRSTSGVLSSAALSKAELETALGFGAAGFLRTNVSGVVSTAALTKAEVEGAVALSSGFVRSTSGVLSAAAIAKGDLASGGVAGDVLTLDVGGTTMSWVAPSGGGGGGAPTGASYVTLATDGGLTSERVLTAGAGVSVTDGGAGGAVTVAWAGLGDVDSTGVVTTLTDPTVIPVTTGFSFGTNPSTTGFIRIANNNLGIVSARNAANTADVALVGLDNTNTQIFGSANGANTNLRGGSASFILLQLGATSIFGCFTTAVQSYVKEIRWAENVSLNPILQQSQSSTNHLCSPLTITAQCANGAGTGANAHGGELRLGGGSRTSNIGRHGGVRISLDHTSAGVVGTTMIEATEVQPAGTSSSRIISLLKTTTAAADTTNLPTGTGDLVIFMGNCAAAPTVNAVGGGILYVESGALKYRGSGGTVTTLGPA